jgi:hypothetical protein
LVDVEVREPDVGETEAAGLGSAEERVIEGSAETVGTAGEPRAFHDGDVVVCRCGREGWGRGAGERVGGEEGGGEKKEAHGN